MAYDKFAAVDSSTLLFPPTVRANLAGVSPNYIINGGFDIWQRGTSISVGTTFTYTADRTFNYRQTLAGGMTVSRQPSGLPGIQYCARIQRDSGNTSTQAMWSDHNLESAQSIPLAGKTVTYSFYARAGANFSPSGSIMSSNLYYSTGIDGKVSGGGFISLKYTDHVLTTSWQRFSVTVSVPSNSTQFAIQNLCVPTGTAGANDWYEITGVQLEVGDVATPFRRNANSIQGELAACQRYYYRFDAGDYVGAQGFADTTSFCQVFLNLPVSMRIKPTSFTTSGSFEIRRAGPAATTVSSFTFSNASSREQIRFQATASTANLVAGQGVLVTNAGSAGATAFYEVSAEL